VQYQVDGVALVLHEQRGGEQLVRVVGGEVGHEGPVLWGRLELHVAVRGVDGEAGVCVWLDAEQVVRGNGKQK